MKYSLSIIVWMLTAFVTYLIVSGAICIIKDCSYREILCNEMQYAAFIFGYWWLPALFVASEVYDWVNKHKTD